MTSFSRAALRSPTGRAPILVVGATLLLGVLANPLRAQTQTSPRDTSYHFNVAGRRTPDARRELVAVPLKTGIRIDGTLDEESWKLSDPPPALGRAEPLDGQPATEATEVRLLYDAEYIYIGAYM